MENVGDYEASVRYYKEALALEPIGTFLWYFINNNLGFSLNALGDFNEGENYCRRAVEIDSTRCNGHKNLGMSLSSQGRYAEAARCFITATQVNAADARSFHLLEKLLGEHPELEYEFADEAACCREAIKLAGRRAEALKPIVYRGWKKRLILLRMKLASFAKRLKSFRAG